MLNPSISSTKARNRWNCNRILQKGLELVTWNFGRRMGETSRGRKKMKLEGKCLGILLRNIIIESGAFKGGQVELL